MIRCAVALVALGLAASAAAAPHKVLVLPLDGNADPATRARLGAQVVRLAHGLDGQVGTAEATFADTALAVGCDPRAPRCRDEVMATLGVDELVWGTATRDGTQTRLIVHRASRGADPREAAIAVAPGEPSDRVDARLAPVFGSSTAAVPPANDRAESAAPEQAESPPAPEAPASGPAAPPGDRDTAPAPAVPPARADHRDRDLGIALAAGGGVSLALGLALWASYSSQQDQIDSFEVRNRRDLDDLRALEDRASRYAIGGDIAVAVGLAAGGIGAYFLVRSHRQRVAVSVVPLSSGAALTLTIPGGL